jgi:hypothetical protein
MDWYCPNAIMLRKFSIDFFKGDHSTVKIPIDISVHMSKNRGKGINLLEYS